MNKKNISTLLHEIGYFDPIENFHLLKGGANNRVYKVDFANKIHPIVLKSYFIDDKDKRDRLSSEFSFLTYAWERNIRCIPQPIKKNSNNIGIYSHIDASPFKKKHLSVNYITLALDFYIDLNKNKDKAKNILNASESCFSIDDYIFSVNTRLEKLSKIKPSNPLNQKALNFIEKDLKTLWYNLLNKLKRFKKDYVLPKEDILISPSDFGFHNALLDAKNNIFFIDFEYAGWDDPAKTISDFFIQPKIKVPNKYLSSSIDKISTTLQHPTHFKIRVEMVFPICQIKWILLLLNSFLDVTCKRRIFSKTHENKEKQLEKAYHLFKKIKI
ncbi:MAG: hypothetical protein K940chlam1_00594 [Candidatus Anoxychlamydiales bacterium]|nr:hypothetical protein [Candidatus Anoxychlamydiales bacterium]NGX35519.1 hypothetical protein [Candidatus Anoxychlamydiales bacterium]